MIVRFLLVLILLWGCLAIAGLFVILKRDGSTGRPIAFQAPTPEPVESPTAIDSPPASNESPAFPPAAATVEPPPVVNPPPTQPPQPVQDAPALKESPPEQNAPPVVDLSTPAGLPSDAPRTVPSLANLPLREALERLQWLDLLPRIRFSRDTQHPQGWSIVEGVEPPVGTSIPRRGTVTLTVTIPTAASPPPGAESR